MDMSQACMIMYAKHTFRISLTLSLSTYCAPTSDNSSRALNSARTSSRGGGGDLIPEPNSLAPTLVPPFLPFWAATLHGIKVHDDDSALATSLNARARHMELRVTLTTRLSCFPFLQQAST